MAVGDKGGVIMPSASLLSKDELHGCEIGTRRLLKIERKLEEQHHETVPNASLRQTGEYAP